MSEVIKKSEVIEALNKMELYLFGCSFDGHYVSVPRRMLAVFSEAYAQDYRPEESLLVLKSYQLLQLKGHYYTHD